MVISHLSSSICESVSYLRSRLISYVHLKLLEVLVVDTKICTGKCHSKDVFLKMLFPTNLYRVTAKSASASVCGGCNCHGELLGDCELFSFLCHEQEVNISLFKLSPLDTVAVLEGYTGVMLAQYGQLNHESYFFGLGAFGLGDFHGHSGLGFPLARSQACDCHHQDNAEESHCSVTQLMRLAYMQSHWSACL